MPPYHLLKVKARGGITTYKIEAIAPLSQIPWMQTSG